MTRTFKLEVGGEAIITIKASGDDETVNYFFDKVLCDSFGILYHLKDTVVKKAKGRIESTEAQS